MYIFVAIYYHNVEHWPEFAFVLCCECCVVLLFCVVFLALYDVALDANAVATVSVVFCCFVGVMCL